MFLRIVYAVFGAAFLLNGLQMLFFSESWYENGPPGVDHTGPMNIHFIRDIGVIFLVMGGGLLWGLFNTAKAYPIHLFSTLWLVGHGLVHVGEIVLGQLPHSHWGLDFVGVFLPGVLMLLLAIPAVWRRAAPNPPAAQHADGMA